MQYQLKKLKKVKQFFEEERISNPNAEFLSGFSDGELNIFQDMLEKMVSSKSAEVYRIAMSKKNDQFASSESSLEESVQEEEEDENEDDQEEDQNEDDEAQNDDDELSAEMQEIDEDGDEQ